MAGNIIKMVSDKKKQRTDNLKKMKIPFKFDIGLLNMFIGCIFKKSVQINRKSLQSMYALFLMIDEESYENNPNALLRLKFIQKALYARVYEGLENEDLIINYCRDDVEDKEVENLISNIDEYKKINYEEIKFINKIVEDRLRFSYILKYRDDIYRAVERLDTGDYVSFKEINDEVVDVAKRIVVDSRNVSIVDESDSFSLEEGIFDNRVTDIVNKLKSPTRILKTGIKALNEMLSPGTLGGRLYMFMGFPGGYKSAIMLKMARDIKKYNPHIETRKPGKKPCVLFVTMENTVDESVERLFNMNITEKDIREFTPKQVIKMLKEEGGFTITQDNEVDIIIKYYNNRSIDTSYLYTLVDDLADQGKEVVALFLDYIKRIRPCEYAKDEKEELKNVTNELKVLAKEYDIPVISAQQLNRAGAGAVDAAMLSNKEDLARLIGRANVGSALIRSTLNLFNCWNEPVNIKLLNFK